MGDTTIVTSEDEGKDVLGEAAVAAAVLSGAAAATAQNADDTASEAARRADTAETLAIDALNRPVGTSVEEVGRIVDEKLGSFKEEIVAAIRESAPAPVAAASVTEVSPSVQPPSVAKANRSTHKRKQTGGERYLGIQPESDDE